MPGWRRLQLKPSRQVAARSREFVTVSRQINLQAQLRRSLLRRALHAVLDFEHNKYTYYTPFTLTLRLSLLQTLGQCRLAWLSDSSLRRAAAGRPRRVKLLSVGMRMCAGCFSFWPLIPAMSAAVSKTCNAPAGAPLHLWRSRQLSQ